MRHMPRLSPEGVSEVPPARVTNDRRPGQTFCAAIGLAGALLILSIHRHHGSTRYGWTSLDRAIVVASWMPAPPLAPVGAASASTPPAFRAFWVGLISLALGVSVVQLASRIRLIRTGGRCGP